MKNEWAVTDQERKWIAGAAITILVVLCGLAIFKAILNSGDAYTTNSLTVYRDRDVAIYEFQSDRDVDSIYFTTNPDSPVWKTFKEGLKNAQN